MLFTAIKGNLTSPPELKEVNGKKVTKLYNRRELHFR